MSPRNFDKINKIPLSKDALDQLKPGMNLWFAFTTITGISNAVQKLFVFTPNQITDNLNKDK